MKIDKLTLKSFKNLKDFCIDFNENSARQVLVGRNGVGKSNIFEALTRIFRDIDLGEDTEFEYELEYECNDIKIKIENQQNNKEECKKDKFIEPKFTRKYFNVNNNESIPKKYFTTDNSKYLPNYVFVYYSGVVDRFDEIFKKHEEIYYKKQAEGEEQPLRPVFQAKLHHSQFALLAFFAKEDKKAQEFLKNEMGIIGIDSVLFSIREPSWSQKKPSKTKRENGDGRFWYAAGKVAPFLDDLVNLSFAPMQGSERVEIALNKRMTKEKRYCFIDSIAKLQELAEGLDSKEFFARLESLFFSDLIDNDGNDIKINILIEGSEETISFKDLSEGERQLITILGLMRFTAEDESLFLLDEPDTHLNPAWCLDYLENLEKYGASPDKSHLIITTHNPLTFAGLKKEEVIILEKGLNEQIYCEYPMTDPRGMGFAAIITSDFFKLRSALDKETLKLIDERREIAFKKDKTDEDRKKLSDLNDKLDRLSFSSVSKDPIIMEFNQAMLEEEKKNPQIKDDSDTEMWKRRKEVARKFAQKIHQEKNK